MTKLAMGKAAVATTATMRAVLQNGFGAPETVLSLREDVPRPVLQSDDEVLVRVVSASVNTPDWISVLGVPYVARLVIRARDRMIGTDVAGIVAAVGPDAEEHFRIGDEVFGSTWGVKRASGTFAEYTVVKAGSVAKKPKSVSFDEAAGAVMSGVTAYQAIRDAAKPKPGTKILINGASGGVGTFAVQMAKAQGAVVTAVCSGRNADLVRSLGADRVIDYTREDYTRGNELYDVILDNVMNRSFKESAKVLNKNGFIIPNSVGVDRSKWFGAIPSFLFKPSNYPVVDCKTTRENLEEVATMIDSGKTIVVVDKVFPLKDASKAVAFMASHRARGQVIVHVSDP